MTDARRSFPRVRGGRTLAQQTTGRTKVLGVPKNGDTLANGAGVSVPGKQLNPQMMKGPSSITETGRNSEYGSATG